MDPKKSGFRIGPEDDGIPSYVRTGSSNLGDRKESRRLTLVNRRITLFSILIPCLVALMLFAAWLEMNRKLAGLSGSGIQEMQTRLGEMEKGLAALSEKNAALETSFRDKQAPLNEFLLVFQEMSDGLDGKLKKFSDQLEMLQSGKVDVVALDATRKELGDELAKTAGEVAAVRKEMESVRTELAAGAEKQAGELAGFAGKLEPLAEETGNYRAELEALKADMSQLKKDVVDELGKTLDRNSLKSAVQSQVRVYQKNVDALGRSLSEKDRSLSLLTDRMTKLEKTVQTLSRQRRLGTPKPGSVIEQDIQ